MGTAIVAIPREDDVVWRLSSEKIPHMTILFLGDQEENPKLMQIVEFLGHATKTTLKRFGLSVDRRGELGADRADVLFFDKNYEFKNLNEFRSFLLANDAISEAYNSVEQFPEWTPHLTMGYPETPAKEDTREYPGISYVGFDRIAIWTGDFDGPEFRLVDRFESNVLEMSSDSRNAVSDILEHFGIKGMKWGVRNDTVAVSSLDRGSRSSQPMIGVRGGGASPTKADVKGLTKASSAAVEGIRSKETKRYLDGLNSKIMAENPSGSWSESKQTSYDKHIADVLTKQANKALKSPLEAFVTPTKSGDFILAVGSKDGVDLWKKDVVTHSNKEDVVTVTITPIRDVNNLVIGFSEENSMSQSNVDDVLEHFGIRGMKWGVRRKNPSSAPASPASSDAARSHDIQKSIKRHGLRAVSNEELKLLNERVQLEQRYSQLFPKKKSIVKMGKDFAWDIIEPVAKQQAKAFLNAQADLKINGPLEVGRHAKKK
jgi:2'-5' RNA ligase